MTSERERCVQLALEITRIEQHHGVAEISDVIQRAREELLAENERLQDSAAAGWAIAKSRLTALEQLKDAEPAIRDALKGEP